ncbi:RcnB family protein [Caballeronia sp. LjRoot31]|uniref:RcnB family protein n=1 Tax=Caballeronia sp. LjRoot31 TaxID=3342324 RepID=UPI003ECEA814
MKTKAIALLMVAALTGAPAAAVFAQEWHPASAGGPDNHGRPDDQGRYGDQGHPGDRGKYGDQSHPTDNSRYSDQDRHDHGWHGSEQADNRRGGPIPHRDWHRGDRLPNEYRDRNYVVDDWRGHGLHQPPRGYHWVGVDGDYVLAAVATGVIANILLSPQR